jgi:SAM-dependent methyltransferase
MPDPDRQQEARRRSFDAVAARYAEVRPSYPAAAFDLIAARVPPPADVLEVGPGPGMATLPMASRGYRIVAVELGERLAAEARRSLAGHADVEVINADFETWELRRPHAFDLLLAASSWHWIDPAVGYQRAFQALRRGGWLALLANHPRPGRKGTAARRFWDATDPLYRRFAPELVRRRGWNPSRLPDMRRQILGSGRFAAVERHVVSWRRDFDPDSYVGLLGTYSDHATLAARDRQRLFDAIRALALDEFGGSVPRYYRTVVYLAQARWT